MQNWCHNCRYHRELRDGVHCGWCLDFFYEHGRLPLKGDRERTALEKLWAEVDSKDG